MRRFSSHIHYPYPTGTVTVFGGRLVACPQPASGAQPISLWLRRRNVSPVAWGDSTRNVIGVRVQMSPLHRNSCPISRYLFHAAGSGRPLRENHISSQFNEPKRNPPTADGFGQTEAQATFQKTDRSEWLRVSPEKTVSAGGNRRGKAGCGSRAPTSPQAGTPSGVIDVDGF